VRLFCDREKKSEACRGSKRLSCCVDKGNKEVTGEKLGKLKRNKLEGQGSYIVHLGLCNLNMRDRGAQDSLKGNGKFENSGQ